MSDDADRAGDNNEVLLPLLINQARQGEYGDSLGFCLDCGDEIPEKRLIAQPGCIRCVDCLEAKGRRR